jgi:hypothetical protein
MNPFLWLWFSTLVGFYSFYHLLFAFPRSGMALTFWSHAFFLLFRGEDNMPFLFHQKKFREHFCIEGLTSQG